MIIPGNSAKMLAPCNFPMVVIGSHMGNHFKPPLDCILSNTVREGSLFVTEIFTYTYGFKEAFRRLDFWYEQDICIFKDGETNRQ